MMEDIKSYSTFTKVQQLDKGWLPPLEPEMSCGSINGKQNHIN